MRRLFIGVVSLWLGVAAFAAGRQSVPLSAGWRFALQPAGEGFAAVDFADSGWATIDVPHTWNAFDGQDGGSYVRGDGWYRRAFDADPAWRGRRVFVEFDAVNRVADVYLNGRPVGRHAGGYSRFRCDLTDALVPGRNVLAVRANNEVNNILPLAGDFTMGGGIYRDVRLLVVDRTHIALQDWGSPGVYVHTEKLSDAEATVVVRTLWESSGEPADTTFHTEIRDATGTVVADAKTLIRVSATGECSQPLKLPKPHRWQGRADPYLYRVRVTLEQNGRAIDSVEQPLGVREFRLDPAEGLFLNGQHVAVHGVNYHQDMLDKGYAATPADRLRDFALMEEMGVTSIRFCHYQHDQQAYDLCDARGLLAWAEFQFHFDVPKAADLAACLANARDQFREMIRQNYNHPAIFCWSIGDETTEEEIERADPMLRDLNALAKAEDPTRPTTYASHHRDEDARNFIADSVGLNPYYGWYYGKPADLGPRLDGFHQRFPKTPLSVSEYGAGASIYQHEQNPPYRNRTQAKGPWHPEEWQNEIHEQSWLTLAPRRYLWGNYIWLMFDFASDRRAEGDHLGRNDKGLVTYDRLTRKDAFFWYKANWTDAPLVYLTSRRDAVRLTPRSDVKVYSNCDTVELFINGVSHGTKTSPERLFIWKDLTLERGPNRVSVEARRGDVRVTDACYWIYTPGEPYAPPTDEAAAAAGK